jgi:hypothetical protein
LQLDFLHAELLDDSEGQKEMQFSRSAKLDGAEGQREMIDMEKRARLFRAGWNYKGRGPCTVKGCTQIVEWWVTPSKKGVAMNYIGLAIHRTTCTGTPKTKLREAPVQIGLFEGK